MKDVDRHLFFDKVKSLGIDSCLYEIPKNDLVDDMKLWPSVTFPDVYCYLIETPGDLTGEKLKAYNFVISGWVKTLQVLKRHCGYDSHDATSPSSSFHILPPTLPSPFLTRVQGYHHGKIVELKMFCRYVLEHFGGLMCLLIFPWNKNGKFPRPISLVFCRPRISVTHFESPGMPLDALGRGGSEG